MTLDTNNLAQRIAQKRDCLARLRDLGVRQIELVEQGDLGALLKVLAAKQHLIEMLQTLERELEPFHAQDPERRRWASAELRRQCADQAEECKQLLAEIVAQERQSESKLIARRDEAADRLNGVFAAGHARNAYAHEPARGASMLDLTSETRRRA
jgi:hypothetical protein